MKIKSINNTRIFINFSKRDMEYINTLNTSNIRRIHVFITDTDYDQMCNNNKGLIPLIKQSKMFPEVKIIVHSFDIRGQYLKKKNVRKFLQEFNQCYKLEGDSYIHFWNVNEKFEIHHNRFGQVQIEIVKKNKPDIITIQYGKKGEI